MRCVPLTSYGFLQTQPLASYALAIQIAFPSVGAAQASFSLTGLPASLGKQKIPDRRDCPGFFNAASGIRRYQA
ncbi:hypothetical protein NX722_14860 [Endozoicomonas gorgoniicola]|uniref:Uncharacterized protein n=1 Tax=Endozoicomonas gorgoniicola TaxID=1234144 RepID=A0ABT3MWX4_9GAMM|nr:hypothetical protein [Endozoicomonas gorgoniicola]MCW7553881.1 hypothetical protein [Endozoicomonas gorgoniicola]